MHRSGSAALLLARGTQICLPRASEVDGERVKHHTAPVRNRDASLSLRSPLPDIVCGSVAGARHDSAGRVEFAGSGVRLHATIRPELDRHTPSRSTADRDHSASKSAPGADTGHTRTIGHHPSLPLGEESWTTRGYAGILSAEPCVSADLGAAPDVDSQVLRSGVASVSSPYPI